MSITDEAVEPPHAAEVHPSPLDRLVALGEEPARRREWPDYLALGVVSILMRELSRAEQNDAELNGFVVGNLVKLRATEAAPLIEAAFAAGRVDEFVRGDWEDVQVDLGLIPERLTPRPRVNVFVPSPAPFERPGRAASSRKARKKAAAAKKAARKARKRNARRR